ncbi:pilus assembly protein [Pseudomonas cannabina]|uniref:Type IV pilus-associated protein n=3 Tax=Pseudomonas syringae group TaxID=136849 RepID=A0A3M3PVV9_PSECA|nr:MULTISPECIES: PilC/PilY family type IV pilus protein [Pseudomonas syringae group]KPB72012.1 Type IV pilus-associated protein [Pseudomonas syringae pv. maculicola]KPW26013.1 putative Type IV pilus-associated protein [Pseudomonas cannabina pv. alisalensis]MBM0140587.1 pilus assembly protein [Pseudomonas cannabina pv. alisalensis]QHE95687.1 pilus assembly protein [Pseudomonas syringae pv. maculicola str. ES4326]QQN22837.1 pilus assembly protein [Pseudomonas cannabina pv. alisalensis]
MSTAKRLFRYFYGALLALYLTTPVYAFTPAQAPLLSASAVPPNLMLLVDNSGSMYNIIWASGFDPTIKRSDISYFSTQCLSGLITVVCPFVSTISGDETLSLGDINGTNIITLSLRCPFGGRPVFRDNIQFCLALPDPAGGGLTRYTANYLSYLIDQVGPNFFGVRNYLNGVIPNDFRMNVAKTVATNLVSNNTSLRIGLATFNEPNNVDLGPGGRIARVVTDLSPVAATVDQPNGVTQAQATANINALRQAITNLNPTANTPLAETYYEITRYFRGMAPFYQSGSNYVSPIQYRCQRNYGVVVTDGLPTYDRTFPTNDPDDALDTTRSLPNWDLNAANDGDDLLGDGEGDRLYLDDLAKFAYDIDLRRDAVNAGGDLTRKSWDNAGFTKQNLSTYTIGFTAANQMLIDTADDNHGHGKYFQTNDSAGLNTALNLALSDIYAKAGSGGGASVSSPVLNASTLFFRTLYDPTDWRGTVDAFNVDPVTGDVGTVAWSTDTTILANSTPAPNYETWNTLSSATIALNFTALSPAQQTAFTATLPNGVNGTQMIAWAKGTANTALRTRTRLLGDLINTNLVVTSPSERTSTDYGTGTSYSDYLVTKASKMNSSLLVNANDGFFNVITPATGQRTYAYMPSTALSSLATIAASNYGTAVHKFTVDGQIAVFDTQNGSNATWRTVAASGLGAGGKAFFAIRLFEGTTNSVGALWEVKAPDTSDTNNRFNNLGYSYSRPEAARMDNGVGVVVVGNGYGSFTGRASLFVLNASTGAVIAEIPTPVIGSETDNGLSSVKLRVNSRNVLQAAYAGDLKGRMWKFDLSSTDPSGWKVAFNGSPLFTAPRGAGQPITVQPVMFDHPLNGKIIYFGTGKFLETADKQTNALQDFYAIWDADNGVGGVVENNLQAQQVVASIDATGGSFFTTSSNTVDWASKKGWYLPLSTVNPLIGERIIFPAQFIRGRIAFATAAVTSTDPCESKGTGRTFQLDPATGKMLTYRFIDTNGDGVINDSDLLVSGIGFGAGIPSLASVVSSSSNAVTYITDSAGNYFNYREPTVFQRIMWRQIQ